MDIINLTNPGAEPVDGDLIERRYPNGTVEQVQYWPPSSDPTPAPLRPQLVVTAIVPDTEHAAQTVVHDLTEVTCPAGTVLTVSAELRDPEGNLLPLSESFRMPLRARDGREKVLLAVMDGGQVTITAPFRESGAWSVTEHLINLSLPAEQQMSFAGVQVYVVEA